MEKIKIFIIDDNVVARSMLARIISEEKDFEVVGESGTAQGGIILLEELFPDIVILEADVSGGMNLEDIIKEINNMSPDTRIIVCADPKIYNLVISATDMGASDFISKPYRKEHIIRTIRENVAKEQVIASH